MNIDWRECAVVETVPGKMGGQPVLKGTRRRPEDLLINREQGVDWLVENYGGVTHPRPSGRCLISMIGTRGRTYRTKREGAFGP